MATTLEPERPASRTARPLRALAPFMRPYVGRLAFALLALIVAAAALLALPVALRQLIDNGFAAEDAAAIDRYFLLLLGVAVVFGGFAALRFYIVMWLGERVVADIRSAVYEHVLRLDPAFFEITKVGEVLSRLTTDTTLIQSIAGVGLSITLRSMLTLSGGLVMLIVTSPRLTAWIVILVPVVLVPIILIGRRVRRLSRATQDRIADTSGLAGEILDAIQIVQAFSLESLQTRRYAETVEHAFATGIERVRFRALLTAIAIFAIFGAVTFVLWLGAQDVLADRMSAGQLGQFLLYAVFVASAAASLSEMWGEIQRAAGATERLMELLHAAPHVRAPATPLALPPNVRGRIEFDDVVFSYPSRPDARALDSLSFTVEPGETFAIVGPSGAGKSTIFQLLLRFYDPSRGRILVDGIDIERLEPKSLRMALGLVPQETVIFGTTASENIRYGRPEASDDEIAAAAIAAGAHEFIEQLPGGYDTFLGERGTRLSGGQRQRIAIARAILRNPPILLLDEATSSLDADSERLVQAALERLQRDRTTLVIAHRLATVLKADRIAVVENGRIVDIGTHADLIASNELYARLAALQFGADGLPSTAAAG
jgi:ATP-binding cassette subfamily B protein